MNYRWLYHKYGYTLTIYTFRLLYTQRQAPFTPQDYMPHGKVQYSAMMLFNSYTTRKLKNKAALSLNQYCMHCYVVLSNVFKLFWLESYGRLDPLTRSCSLAVPFNVCLCLLLYHYIINMTRPPKSTMWEQITLSYIF